MARRYQRREYGSFVADIEEIVAVSEARMVALTRQSLQDMINIVQEPVGKGGRMRIDTGFLRASGQASLIGMPSGPVRGDKTEPDSYAYNEATTTATIGNLKFGNTFFFGWTAAYARYREVYDGFLERGLQQWGRIVAINTDVMRERIKK